MKTLLTFICLMAGFAACYAQNGILEKEFEADSILTHVLFKSDTLKFSIERAPEMLSKILKLNTPNSFKLANSKTDEYGFSHFYYLQYFSDVRVDLTGYAIHVKNGFVQSINGRYCPIKKVKEDIKTSEGEALEIAMKEIGANDLSWKDEIVKGQPRLLPKGEKVIVQSSEKFPGEYRVAYRFDIETAKPLDRRFIYIDATNGDIVANYSAICQVNATGTAATRYSGSVTFTTDVTAGVYTLHESRAGHSSLRTLNMSGKGANFLAATEFTDNDNSWTEFNNAAKDNAALDAHWGGEKVLDYWLAVFGRSSVDGLGSEIVNYVHTDLTSPGLNFQNNDQAFYLNYKMVYGDGTTQCSPLTSFDITAHEISHGVAEKTCNLNPIRESGAINEGLGDIWAAVIEEYTVPSKSEWLIGEDITIVAPNFLRSMSSPNSGVPAQPDTYFGTNWFDTTQGADAGGIHINNGVINFWFFLLAAGGSGTNDNGKCFNVPGIGMADAAKIIYNVESAVLVNAGAQQFVSFAQFRTATLTAATNLGYGVGSAQRGSLIKAWNAVGVGNPIIVTPTIAKSSANQELCVGESWTLTANTPDAPTNFGYDWYDLQSTQVSSSGVLLNGSSYTQFTSVLHTTTNVVTLTGPQGYGLHTIKVRLNDGVCSSAYGSTASTSNFDVGTLTNSQFSIGGPSSLCSNTVGYFNASTPFAPGITGYTWTASGNFVSTSGQNTASFAASAGSPFYGGAITLKLSNRCGITGVPYVKNISSSGCFSFMAAPNPVNENLKISFGQASNFTKSSSVLSTESIPSGTADSLPITGTLINNTGQSVWSGTIQGDGDSIDTSKLLPGIYILKLNNGTETSTKRIIVE